MATRALFPGSSLDSKEVNGMFALPFHQQSKQLRSLPWQATRESQDAKVSVGEAATVNSNVSTIESLGGTGDTAASDASAVNFFDDVDDRAKRFDSRIGRRYRRRGKFVGDDRAKCIDGRTRRRYRRFSHLRRGRRKFVDEVK